MIHSYSEGVVSTSPNPQAVGKLLVGCQQLLIQYICSYLPKWRLFLYPQPEDVPCRLDKNPFIMDMPPLTKYHLARYCTAIVTVNMSHSTEGNCHRKCGWYNLYTMGHNACNCLHAWKIEHIMYIQKKSLVSKWCFVAATPIHIHHHTSNHNLTISLFVFMFCIQHSAAAVAADTFRHSWHNMANL